MKYGRYSGQSRNKYGTQKIKVDLYKKDLIVSQHRIGWIMKQEELVSACTVAQYKPHIDQYNESKVQNIADRTFTDQPQYNVVISNLTYVRVGNRLNYMICSS